MIHVAVRFLALPVKTTEQQLQHFVPVIRVYLMTHQQKHAHYALTHV